MAAEVASAREKGADSAAIKAIEDSAAAADSEVQAKIEEVRRRYASLADKVGVFEGAGYSAKGLYRSQMYCIMISSPKKEFCAVCRRALAAMIDYYCGK
jgi:hypothetical protein